VLFRVRRLSTARGLPGMPPDVGKWRRPAHHHALRPCSSLSRPARHRRHLHALAAR